MCIRDRNCTACAKMYGQAGHAGRARCSLLTYYHELCRGPSHPHLDGQPTEVVVNARQHALERLEGPLEVAAQESRQLTL
eukprot:6873433-Prymnesium_polylepis.2